MKKGLLGFVCYVCVTVCGFGQSNLNFKVTQVGFSNSAFSLSFAGQPGYLYAIQYKNSLNDPSWTALPPSPAAGGLATLRDTSGSGAARFYRVVSEGPLTIPLTPFEPPAEPPAEPGGSDGSYTAAPDASLPYLFSGEFHLETSDLVIKGRGMDFVWARKYRSKAGSNTPQGNGWDYSYDMRVAANGPAFDVYDGNGRKDTYQLQADGTYGVDQLFSVGTVSNGVFTLKFPDGGTWTFLPPSGSASQGKVSSITDRNGNAMSFAYSSAGVLTNVVDTLGRSIGLGYDGNGLLASVTDFAGRTVRYAYYQNGDSGGALGDLKSVTSPAVTNTPTGNDFPAGKTVTYAYSQGLADPNLNHKLLTITDANGQTWLSNTYATTTNSSDINYGRLMSQARGYSNEILSFYYAAVAPAASNSFAVTKAIVNDRTGNVSEYLFDYLNRMVRLREFTGRAQPGQQTTDTLNLPKNPLRGSDPAFFESDYQWNADSKLALAILPNGNRVTCVYEGDLNPNVPRRARGNLRSRSSLAGQLASDQTIITESYVYDTTPVNGVSRNGFNVPTQMTDGRGTTTLYSYDARGNRTNTVYGISSITESYEYNSFGQMTAHTWPDNGSNHRQRDVMSFYTNGVQNGYLAQEIEDSGGLALATISQYDAVGNVVQLVDPRGKDTLYSVNALGQVVRETTREVSDGSGIRYQRDTIYDANNNIASIRTLNMDQNGVIGENPYATTTYAYDIMDLVTNISQTVNSSNTVVTAYAYDANRNRNVAVSGEASSGSQPHNVVTTLYDERNLPYQETCAPGDPAQSTLQIDYDANGNRVRVTQGLEDTASRITTFAFDGFDRCIGSTDPNGGVATIHYDAAGNVSGTRMDGQLSPPAGGTSNVRLAQTTYAYDVLNRKVSIDHAYFDPATGTNIAGGHAICQFAYTSSAQPLQIVDPNGHTNTTVYDGVNRPSVVTDAKGNTSAYTYDAGSRLVQLSQTDVSDLGSPSQVVTTTYGYDNLDRLIQTTDGLGNTRHCAYDSHNNVVLATDPRGNATSMTYDGLNRLVTVSRALTSDGTGGGAPAGTIVCSQGWDSNSRLATQTDANGNTTTYAYDALDRLSQTTYADGTRQNISYDSHDNKVLITDANGNSVSATYDLLNRVISRKVSRGSDVGGTTSESYQYDGMSRTLSAQNDDSLVTRSYDSLSHIVKETQQVVSSGAPAMTLAGSYDAVGNLLALSYPGGRTVQSSYDALCRRQTVSDSLGTIATYSYTGPIRVQRRDYGNGTRASLTYDGVRRMTNSVQSVINGGTLIDSRAYAWDPSGNQTVMNGLLHPSQDFRSFSYDSVNRLVQSVTAVSGPTIAYQLDGAGNRASDNLGSYFLNSSLPPGDYQMNQYTSTPFDARAYDANGNLADVTGGSPNQAQRHFTYDYRNRLVAVSQFDGFSTYTNVVTLKHDCFGRRIEKAGPAGVSRFYYAEGREIEEQNSTNSTVATYVWGGRASELLSMDRNGQRYFYHADDLGSIRAVTDSTARVLEQYLYGDYGQPTFYDGTGSPLSGTEIGNPALFGARRYDPETGYYYDGGRYLDPAAGRFISADPWGIWNDSRNLGNRSSYSGSNPESL